MVTTTLHPPSGRQAPRTRRRRWAVVVLVLLLVLGAWAWRAQRGTDIRAGTTPVDTVGMAARYGIDVSLVAVTAAGGLLELRYQVVDPDKADRLIHDSALAPALVVETTGATLVMSSPPHHHGTELQLGGTYFFLMANARNAVHRGDRVTLVIGDARLEHLEAQG